MSVDNLWLDYDGTLSLMPDDGIGAIINLIAALCPIHCAIVTYRHEDRAGGNQDVEEMASVLGIPVIYTAGQAKAAAVGESGHTIWIDDQPETILFDASELSE